jgi:hypothetical protein
LRISEAVVHDRQQRVDTGNLMRIHLSDFENTAVAATAPTERLSGTVVRRIAPLRVILAAVFRDGLWRGPA